jgi:REP element-mobilizing transposase RayT
MARAWRIEYDGAYYHVLSRGNEGRDIFHDGKDRSVFLDTLGEVSDRFEIDVYAFVLMSNHISRPVANQTGESVSGHAMVWRNL